ncbi:hypothetical protein TRFO_28273 [Tritrichomonas foetus]|uniref:Uncharacterized protein n=1 Tax=Tritrichomonas foetus TaxID=1144522 RepID=A0A1J4JYP9_9EUKA|nr:hypothetical protein TRFO_28273 [Tritrichomonas foetus]|eukprot:OHT04281.1 hypothetical protein TRFO_28273 [Tritrichomonas foetus]
MNSTFCDQMDPSVATSAFTELAIEDQIRNVWKEIESIRNMKCKTPHEKAIQDWQILRLMEVHNRLDIETTRQQENHLKQLMNMLKLDEIDAKVSAAGIKAKIMPEMSNKNNSSTTETIFTVRDKDDKAPIITDGFVDPMYKFNDAIAAIASQSSSILIERKREINKNLIILNHKRHLTHEEMKTQKHLMAELRALNGA